MRELLEQGTETRALVAPGQHVADEVGTLRVGQIDVGVPRREGGRE
jgi:hypothetical protein